MCANSVSVFVCVCVDIDCVMFVFSGKIPMGYRYLAQSTSENTHQIPISEFEQAEKDYRKILGEIETFLDPYWTENMPPVFSKV